MNMIIEPKEIIKGVLNLPGDKFIAHSALILGIISNGQTRIKNFCFSKSCIYMIKCLRNLGADIKINLKEIIINGSGLYGLKKPKKNLDTGASDINLILLLGLLSAQKFNSKIYCHESLKDRLLIDEILMPLKQMGANIIFKENYFDIKSSKLDNIKYKMPIVSKEVKSAILLASLYCDYDKNKKTEIIGGLLSVDHTENVINYFGGDIIFSDNKNKILGCDGKNLTGREINLPGDASLAAFFIVLAIIMPESHIILNNILINPRRMGLINTLKQMGAKILINNTREIYSGELIANIEVFYSKLKAIEISGQMFLDMIDEIYIFIIAALFADGKVIIKNVNKTLSKEFDRIKNMTESLNKLGAEIIFTHDEIIINNNFKHDFNLEHIRNIYHDDYKIMMSLIIFLVANKKRFIIKSIKSINDSFPGFIDYINTFL